MHWIEQINCRLSCKPVGKKQKQRSNGQMIYNRNWKHSSCAMMTRTRKWTLSWSRITAPTTSLLIASCGSPCRRNHSDQEHTNCRNPPENNETSQSSNFDRWKEPRIRILACLHEGQVRSQRRHYRNNTNRIHTDTSRRQCGKIDHSATKNDFRESI
ncbi:hypothetical protein VTN77DRAFT_1386 [Rasamsonia byssochlamydoides]|uniref:uncharacterized protein n=1 Tax=Rasamsonia byssochlamydoides TaxID=89139 RepID=UPI003742AAEE